MCGKKLILLLFFTILLIGRVYAGGFFPSFQEIIERRSQQQDQGQDHSDQDQQTPQPTCNNDGVCNIGESNSNCPADCPVEQRQTTQTPPATSPDTNTDDQNIVTDEETSQWFSRGLMTATIFVLVFVVLLIVLGFWLYGGKRKGKITLGKKKEEKRQDLFKLPQRPARRFGI
ncbi:MAG: hypothetical protein ABIB47_02740 [Candidatus Woesearchaeota archaeon]